jgi:prevent-host-death family protein
MASTGIRELRQRASELLRRVEAGETIEITDRGRPVAVLAPLPDQRPIDRLRATGDLEPAGANLKDLPEPLSLAPGQEPPSRVLERLRRDER